MQPAAAKKAVLYRMAGQKSVCPHGLKARGLLRRKGFTIEDHKLATRAETEAFKAQHQVATTPQIFIDGERIGGFDDLQRHLGIAKQEASAEGLSYQPVLALFGVAALMALATSLTTFGTPFTVRAGEWFVAFSMCLLAMMKLRDVERFATMFLSYDLLAQQVPRYGYVYPFAELFAGVLMVAGIAVWASVPVALFIGGIGAVSVFKAVYIDRRALKCACVGGDSNVPLGFVSLTENLMMLAMAFWMLGKGL